MLWPGTRNQEFLSHDVPSSAATSSNKCATVVKNNLPAKNIPAALSNISNYQMAYLDRTQQFVELVEKFRNKMPGTSHAPTRIRDQTSPSSLSRPAESFNVQSADVVEQLNSTQRKLVQLNNLVKQRGIFNDKTAKIQELTFDIKQSITALNGKLEVLEDQAESCAEAHRSSAGGNSNSSLSSQQYRAHFHNMVEALKGRLLQMTKEFKEALELRTKTMRQQDSRRGLYSFNNAPGASSSMVGGGMSQDGLTGFADPGTDIESGTAHQTFQFAERGSAYLRSRTEAMENVQKVLGELGQIFNKVATMVTHQEEMVQRIDDDVDSSLTNLKEGESQLLKYFQTISSNRSLILKVFAIMFLFIVFFVVFLA